MEAFRGLLHTRVGSRVAPLASVLVDFQREALTELDKAFLAVATGVTPDVRKFYLEWVKGCAKTTLIASCLLWLLIFARRPVEIRIGAGDQEQAAESRLVIRSFLRDNEFLEPLVAVNNWEIRNLNPRMDGARIVIVSADAKTQHGSRPLVTFADEFVHMDDESYYDALLANQAKVPDGLTLVASNCGILGTWQHKRREHYRQSPEWFFHQRSDPPPWMVTADLEELQATMPAGQFNRLFRGIWSPGSEAAIREEDLQAAITLEGPLEQREPDYSYFGGVDVGISHDHAAVVLVGVNYRTRRIKLARVCSWKPQRGQKIQLELVQAAILSLHEQFYPLWWYDVFQMELMQQQLSREGVRMQAASFSGASAMSLANAVLESFSARTIDLYPDQELIDDLRKLELILKPQGWRLSAARDKSGHADRGISLSLALAAAKANPPIPFDLPVAELCEMFEADRRRSARYAGARGLELRHAESSRRPRRGPTSDEDDEGWERVY